jgi:hypothetical protein
MKLIQDIVGTTYHVAKRAARSNLKRKLITTIAANVIGKLKPKHGKRVQQIPS